MKSGRAAISGDDQKVRQIITLLSGRRRARKTGLTYLLIQIHTRRGVRLQAEPGDTDDWCRRANFI